MGEDFLTNYARDGSYAWKNLMLAVIANLNTLASSELVAPLRDLINIAKDVEDQIRKSRIDNQNPLGGDRRLPMDVIGTQWRSEPSPPDNQAKSPLGLSIGSGVASSKRKLPAAGSGRAPAISKDTDSLLSLDPKLGQSTD